MTDILKSHCKGSTAGGKCDFQDGILVDWKADCERWTAHDAIADGKTCKMNASSHGGCPLMYYEKVGSNTCEQTPAGKCHLTGGKYDEKEYDGRTLGVCRWDAMEFTKETFVKECKTAGGVIHDETCVRPNNNHHCNGTIDESGKCVTSFDEDAFGKCTFREYKKPHKVTSPSGEVTIVCEPPSTQYYLFPQDQTAGMAHPCEKQGITDVQWAIDGTASPPAPLASRGLVGSTNANSAQEVTAGVVSFTSHGKKRLGTAVCTAGTTDAEQCACGPHAIITTTLGATATGTHTSSSGKVTHAREQWHGSGSVLVVRDDLHDRAKSLHDRAKRAAGVAEQTVEHTVGLGDHAKSHR